MWTGEYRSRSERVGCSDPGPQLARAGRARCRSRSERLFLVPAGNAPAAPHETPTAACDLEHLRSGAVSRGFSQSVVHFGCGAKASLLCKQASAGGFQPGRSPIAETTRGDAPPSLCKKFGAKPHHRNKAGRSPPPSARKQSGAKPIKLPCHKSPNAEKSRGEAPPRSRKQSGAKPHQTSASQ